MNNLLKTILFVSLGLFLNNASKAECTTNVPVSNQESTFLINPDGTVSDLQNKLMWKKCTQGQIGSSCEGKTESFTWAEALEAAELSSFADYNDWRVPNIKELRSIVDYSCNNPAINQNLFPNTKNWYYWSSTPYAKDSNHSWRVLFSNGNDFLFRRDRPYLVRLVRDL